MIACATLAFAGILTLMSPSEEFAQARIVSPEIHADRSITFRLRSPNSSKVELSFEGTPGAAMSKDADGVWSHTTKPLAPDIYGYSFIVDGVGMLDPGNPEIKPNLIWVGNMVTVPGAPPEAWEVQSVPHGALHRHFYKSGIIGDERDYYVYTPPGYDGKKKLPTLYLLHGFSDMANGWTAVGKAHVILDNLMAQKKAKSMLVVMPLGYGVPDFAKPGGASFRDRNLTLRNFTKFREALLEEVIPRVEKGYSASAKREDRAIAGLSMGGAETLFTGLNHLDKFAHIGAFSSGGLPAQTPEEVFPNLKPEEANKLRTLWIVCGTDDGLIGFHRGFTGWLKDKGIRYEATETPGGHVWMLWRRNLITFCSRIFGT